MTPDDTQRGPTRRRRLRSLRGAVVALTVLAAVPAGAAVLIQNFVRADITAVAPCLTKIGGVDAKTYHDATKAPYIGVDTAKTIATADKVNLLNETVSFKAFQGDRLTVTDGMRVKNGCD